MYGLAAVIFEKNQGLAQLNAHINTFVLFVFGTMEDDAELFKAPLIYNFIEPLE